MSHTTAPVPEEPVRLRVNGLPLATWSASPAALEALGAGRLVAAGFVHDRADLLGIQALAPEHGIHRVHAEVAAERAATAIRERDHRREHGCGLRFLLDCRPELLPDASERDARVPDLDAFPDLFRELFDRSPSRETTGGHHTTALTDGTRLMHAHDEVGRHNGADKAIGAALLAGDDLGRLGMLTSARISGEIAEKAARAGLAWVASRSVPSTLAVEIAAAAGMPLIARAPRKDARVFS